MPETVSRGVSSPVFHVNARTRGITMSDSCNRLAIGIFNFALVVLVPTPLKAVAVSIPAKKGEGPKISSLFQHFVATLHHDNNCCTRHQ